MKRFAWLAALSAAFNSGPLTAQEPLAVATRVGVTQLELAGLLEQPVVTDTKVKGQTITATTPVRVRANVPWLLTVSLVPPVPSGLMASFRVGNGRAVELTASRPSATVTTGTLPCLACLVTLDWDFTYKTSGKQKEVPRVPQLLFEAKPNVRP